MLPTRPRRRRPWCRAARRFRDAVPVSGMEVEWGRASQRSRCSLAPPAPVRSRRPPTCNFVTFATYGGPARSNPGLFPTSTPAALRGKRAIRHAQGSTCNKPAAAGSPAVKMKRNSSGTFARGLPPRIRGAIRAAAAKIRPARAGRAARRGGSTGARRPGSPRRRSNLLGTLRHPRRAGVQPAGRALQGSPPAAPPRRPHLPDADSQTWRRRLRPCAPALQPLSK